MCPNPELYFHQAPYSYQYFNEEGIGCFLDKLLLKTPGVILFIIFKKQDQSFKRGYAPL